MALFLSAATCHAVQNPSAPDLRNAEALYKNQFWKDAERAFLGCAAHAPDSPSAYEALHQAGLCRLKMRDEKGAMDLFERVAGEPVAVKSSPESVAASFDQLHALLVKQEKRPAREKVIDRCRKALPAHSVNARLCEREGDTRLVAGASPKALEYYALAGAGLSGAGTNIVRLLASSKSGLGKQTLTQADADRLAAVAASKPLCGIALCDLLSKRKDGWRAEDALANAADQPENYAALISPENVTLGMTRDAIQSARPEARKLDSSLVVRRPNAVALTELKKDVSPAICYQYHFVDNQLRAVTKGILHAGKRNEQKVKHLHGIFSKDLVKQVDEQIIRLDANMQQVPVTAELWKDEKNGICVYFVDTSKGTTIITFDPRYFAKKDFFVTADQMPDIAPALETVRKQIEESKKLKK